MHTSSQESTVAGPSFKGKGIANPPEDESEWEQAAAWRQVSALLCPLGRVRTQERRWAEDNGGRRLVPPDAKKDFLRAANMLPDNPEKAARIVAKYVGR